jgi:NAD(P)-dependent dehydrogenase (short-subunit alcohol dehydrogenase family)
MSVAYNFEGRVALVTGGNSGMGLATAWAFARAGTAVTVVGLGEEQLGRAVEEFDRPAGRRSASTATLLTRFKSPPWSNARWQSSDALM